jgi:hypothetical protein
VVVVAGTEVDGMVTAGASVGTGVAVFAPSAGAHAPTKTDAPMSRTERIDETVRVRGIPQAPSAHFTEL